MKKIIAALAVVAASTAFAAVETKPVDAKVVAPVEAKAEVKTPAPVEAKVVAPADVKAPVEAKKEAK